MTDKSEGKRPLAKSRQTFYYLIFKRRGILMTPAMALLLLWPWWQCRRGPGLVAVGVLCFSLGIVLRIWAQRHFKYRLRQGRWLTVTGPFAWTRNPVYIGNLLLFAGLCVLCGLPWLVLAVCGWAFLVYQCAVRFEEQRLAETYGDEYAAYRQRVGRWWPRRPVGGGALPVGAVGWARAIAVEWHCLLLLLIPVVREAVARWGLRP